MKRREFVKWFPSGGLGLFAFLGAAHGLTAGNQAYRFSGTRMIAAAVSGARAVALPEGKRVAFGWSALQLDPGSEMTLMPFEKLPEGNMYLRFTPALEMRDTKLLHVSITGTSTSLGAIDIRFSSALVPYEMEIGKEFIPAINKNGLTLRLESETSFGFYSQPVAADGSLLFVPHFLTSSESRGSLNSFLDCFTSVKSVQTFGWREGAVLDGLWQLHARKRNSRALSTIKEHFDLFLDDNGDLQYETAWNDITTNQASGIESTLPFATLARVYPDHPLLEMVVEAWGQYSRENGMVTDGPTITAEGCYTVAYPMAVIGKGLKRRALKEKALEQLKHRFVLIKEGNLNLRFHSDRGTYSFQNWARGAAWTLLGFARTIAELKDDIQDENIFHKFREGVDIAIGMQQEDGMWNGFMDARNAPDTSGSAGIAAAILIGIREGILPASYRTHAEKCWNALPRYLTPDGLLKGACQDNRGGVSLQQGDYRVIAQMAMGLMAQLYAEI